MKEKNIRRRQRKQLYKREWRARKNEKEKKEGDKVEGEWNERRRRNRKRKRGRMKWMDKIRGRPSNSGVR